ncbi:MAG: ABC transporter permease subunit, partial [Anaerolineae bacterium]|nr:ABC transporter permease subunit [Anaerolineae bacterium]
HKEFLRMKIFRWIVVPLMVALFAAIAATYILYQLVALTPSALPMNAQARPTSYTEWLFGSYGSRGVVNGDFGDSLMMKRPAAELVAERLPASLELFIPAVWQSLLFGIPLGILLALLRRWLTDGFLRPFMWLGISIPTFWLALMLILVFAIQRQEFPVGGRCPITLADGCAPASERLEYLVLPLRALVIHWTCIIALTIRTGLMTLLQKELQTALKTRHLLDGVLIPTLTLLPVLMAGMVSTQILVETVFAWPGIGRLALQGVMQRDTPVLMATVVQVVLWLIGMFFTVTVINGLIGLLRGQGATSTQTAEKPQARPDTPAYEPVGLFDEPKIESPSLRPVIDRVYTAVAVIAAVIVLGITLVSLQPSLVTSADPLQTNPADRLQAPGAEDHPYGTDDLGRDLQARLLAAGKTSLQIGFVGALVALVVGGIVGFVGGLFMDSIGVLLNIPINAVMIGLNLLPTLALVFLLVGVITLDQTNLPLILGLVFWGNTAVTIRAKVTASIRGEKQSGRRWLLTLVYALTFNMAVLIGVESGVSFLGIGVQPPNASWGSLLATALSHMARAAYLVVLPGLFITVTVLCLHIVASRIQDNKGFLPELKIEPRQEK